MAPKPEAVRDLITQHIAAWCAKSPEGVAASYTEDATFSINRGDAMVGHQDIAEQLYILWSENLAPQDTEGSSSTSRAEPAAGTRSGS